MTNLGSLTDTVAHRLARMGEAQVTARIWRRDPSVWNGNAKTPELADRLGWLTLADQMQSAIRTLRQVVAQARNEFDRGVLCGMGGSSLAPYVFAEVFGSAPGHPRLLVLDSTDPRVVAAVSTGDLRRALIVISSKSGTTLEPDCFLRHFWALTGERGAQFVAITDPDTPLARLARERQFREVFPGPPDVGGRYSALTHFGLVPAALLGVDLDRLLGSARQMAARCGPAVPPSQNPGAQLGAALGEAALAGRDKLTFVLSPSLASFGLW